MYLEAAEVVLMGDRFCEVASDLWENFILRWGRSPAAVVIEACVAAGKIAESIEEK